MTYLTSFELILQTIFFFILGSIFGSFLLVVASRMGVKSLMGRSKCDACSTQLRSIDLIPIFSYLFLGGRCRSCKSRIPAIAFWSELLLGISFAVHSLIAPNMVVLGLGLVIISICAVLALYDAKTQFLPTNYLLSLLIIAIVYQVFVVLLQGEFSTMSLVYTLVPALVLGAVVWLSSEKMMGIGDPLLLLSLSLVVGSWQGALFTLLFASWGGLLYVIFVGITDYVEKRKVLKTKQIAFGPFLIAGFLLSWWMSLLGMLSFV